MIEEDMESESETEVDETEEDDTIPMDGFFSCEYCNAQFGISKYYKAHIESHKYEDIRDIASLCINLSPKTVQFSPPIFGQFCEKLIFFFSP